MSYRIAEIEGIGPKFAERLGKLGITTTDHLLAECGSAKGRKGVSERTGLKEAVLLKWTNMADLMRIRGVGEEFSELLEAAGVDTVKELNRRNADTLAAKMKEVNAAKKLTRQVPAASQVARWVEHAKTLKPMITY
jgi:predicted flap endonuclease-1-like 5' DNA nuclease